MVVDRSACSCFVFGGCVVVAGVGFAEFICGFCLGLARWSSRAALYLLPRVALHLRHDGTRLSSSDVPPLSVSMR